jgi:hypothetical protein
LPDERSPQAVLEWIRKQGYGVEHEAAAILSRAGFRSRQGLTYRDPRTEKVRDVDVVATPDFVRAGAVEVHVILECKRSEKAWITRRATETTRKGIQNWLPVASESVRDYLVDHRIAISGLKHSAAFDVIETRQEKKELNPGYEAMAQVVSAANGLRTTSALFPNAVLFHPVVVLDASLYRVHFDIPGTDVEAINRERVYWSGSQVLDAPVLVDVVTIDGLADYARDLHGELDMVADELARANHTFHPDPTIQIFL